MIVRVPCISLWQPFASLLFAQGALRKVHETRSFPFPSKHFGVPIAIHATQRLKDIDELQPICAAAFGADWRRALPRGAVIGTVVINQWSRTQFVDPASDADRAAGDWSRDRYAWLTERPLALPNPVPGKGRQGWFSVELPQELVAT